MQSEQIQTPKIQEPQKTVSVQYQEGGDNYENLMREGKQVIDNIHNSHQYQQDIFYPQNQQEEEPFVAKTNANPIEEEKICNQQENAIRQDSQSKNQLYSDNKNENDNNLSMAKKNSKIVPGCNCIKSKCTKNYCECFTQGKKCNELCKCTGCENQGQFDSNKYRSNFEAEDFQRICNCKKSNCLKKYCQCYNSGLKCTSNCKCQECKNGLEDMAENGQCEEEEKEQMKKERSPEEVDDLNAKINEITRLVSPDQQEYVLSFLEYWLS